MGLLEMAGRLSLNSAPFHSALKAADLSAKQFGKTLKSNLVSTFGPTALFAAGGMAVRSIIDYADQTEELAQRLRTGTDAAQEWTFAARLNGEEAGFVALQFQKMEKALIEAGNGSKSAQKSLAALGISMDEVKTISVDAAMRRLQDPLAKVGTESDKAAAFLDIFSRSSSKLRVVLDDLGKGAMLTKLGVFANEDAIRNVKLYADAWDTVFTVLTSRGSETISPGGILATMASMTTGGGVFKLLGLDKAINRLLAGTRAKPEVAGRQTGETDEERLARETEAQHRITALINKTVELRRSSVLEQSTEEEKLNLLIKEREDIFKRIGTNEETRLEKEKDLAENELEIARVKHALDAETFRDKRGTQLSPLSDSLRAVGNFLGGDPNSGVVRQLSEQTKQLQKIERNTGRQAQGAQFPL